MRWVAVFLMVSCTAVCASVPGAPDQVRDSVAGTTEVVVSVLIPAQDGREAFYMTQTEIPWDLFGVFAYSQDIEPSKRDDVDAEARPSKPYYLPDEGFGHKGYPALAMTEKNAEAFAVWLSEKTGQSYRLPTEAEWEHACRGGAETPPETVGDYAWYWDNADDKTGPVGAKQPNPYGIHDALGNVAEFAWAEDGTAVIKGGSFRTDGADLSCEWRQSYKPSWNATDPQFPKSVWWYADGSFLGFRLLREVE